VSGSGGELITGALSACLVTVALEPVVISYLRRREVFDVPGERSNHTVPTPRGGGLALIAGVLVGVLVSRQELAGTLLLGIVVAAAVGLAEDLRGLSIMSRLSVAAGGGACLVLALVPHVESSGRSVAALVMALPWTLALVNAVNFMDGINGISAATAIVTGCAYAGFGLALDSAAVTILGAATAAAALGFAPFNVPRARVFLGDVGSYGIGATFSAMSLLAVVEGLPVVAAVGPLLIYLADTALTIARRFHAREPLHHPHKRHVYQRLVALGLSHLTVTAMVALLTAVCAALGAVALSGSVAARSAAAVGLLMVVGGYLASPRLLTGRVTVAS